MNRLKTTLIASVLLLTLACDAPENIPTGLAPSFAANGNGNGNGNGFRFVDNERGNNVVGEVAVVVRDLYMMNLVTGNSKGVVTNPSVTWTTSNPLVATVTANKGRALVRMVGPGYATIRANLGNADALVTFHVFGPANRYIVTSSNASPVVGSSILISARVADVLNQPLNLSGRTVTWSSTNGGTFTTPSSTTDANGIATASFIVGTNTSTPHATRATDDSGVTGVTNVYPRAGAAASIEVSVIATLFPKGSSVPVFATVRDAYGNTASGVPVIWSWTGSLTVGTPNPELTDADGRVLGAFTTAATPGTYRVTATTGSLSAQTPVITTY